MSKRILFDFECAGCGAQFEELVPPEVEYMSCTSCDYVARRQISPVRIDLTAMSLSSSASPESIAHFDRVHRERRAIEEKRKAEHGDYGKPAGAD